MEGTQKARYPIPAVIFSSSSVGVVSRKKHRVNQTIVREHFSYFVVVRVPSVSPIFQPIVSRNPILFFYFDLQVK